MSGAILFDTHAFVKDLTEAGMPVEQAEALARSQAGLMDERPAAKQDMEELEIGLRREMKEVELRLTIRLGSMTVAAVGVAAVLAKLL